MEPLVITLPGPPVGKGRPRFARSTGHAFTPAKTRSYEGMLRLAGEQSMAGRELLSGPLAVVVTAGFPIPESWSKKRKASAEAGTEKPTVAPDADNLLKVLDALNEVVWRDDKQIVEAVVRKVYTTRPALSVEVRAA